MMSIQHKNEIDEKNGKSTPEQTKPDTTEHSKENNDIAEGEANDEIYPDVIKPTEPASQPDPGTNKTSAGEKHK